VIYNEATDKGNDMFDLSRQIINEGGAIVITPDNLATTVEKITLQKIAEQKKLF